MKELRGFPAAKTLMEKMLPRLEALKNQGVHPQLAIVRIGNNPDDIFYEKSAQKRLEKLGMLARSLVFPEDISTDKLKEAVEELNADKKTHGILILRPLPAHIDYEEIRRAVAAYKDVDGMSPMSQASLLERARESFAPCTAEAVLALLKFYEVPLCGSLVAVVGRSTVVGKPLALLLLAENATPIMCHSKTKKLAELCRRADIVISACGQAEALDERFVTQATYLVDVGINVTNTGELVGDVSQAAKSLCQAASPVPGGVGALTTTILAEHLLLAAEASLS